MKKNNLANVRFGRLVVLEEIQERKSKKILWNCLCDCGATTEVFGCHLASGHTKSCGCLAIDEASTKNVSHRMTGSRVYTTWLNMKARCYNEKHNEYENYGGRGIVVCDEWKYSFDNFMEWAMASGYSDILTIDRIDNNGNYKPGNCQWISRRENTLKRNSEYWSLNRNIRDSVVYFSSLLKSFGISYASSSKLFSVNHRQLMSAIQYRIKNKKVDVLGRMIKS